MLPTYDIYRITCKCGLNYIGSTNNFKQRMIDHKKNYYNENRDNYNNKVYKHIRSCCKFTDCYSSVIFTGYGCYKIATETETKYQYEYDSVNNGLNTYYARRSGKQRYQDNKQKIIEKNKEYYENHKKQINEKKKEKFICECGGSYTRSHKAEHEKTKKHQEFIKQNN